MARMKWDDSINWRELNNAEYEEGEDFDAYEGPVPPSGTLLNGQIKKIWATESANGDQMLKVLFEADGNTGDRKQYNGCPIWDNVCFTMPQVKFRWQPFLDALELKLQDLARRTVCADEDDNIGTPILKIGNVKFPADISVKTAREKYEGETTPRVKRYLPAKAEELEDDEEDDFDDEDEDEF